MQFNVEAGLVPAYVIRAFLPYCLINILTFQQTLIYLYFISLRVPASPGHSNSF